MMRRTWALFSVMVVATLGIGSAAYAQNVIQTENAKTGATDWKLTNSAQQHEIEGYASLTSVNRGGQISLYVNTSSPTYNLDIFRLGWYGGLGARRMGATMAMNGTAQAACPRDATTGMTECRWVNPAVLTVPGDADPTNWASGVYLAKLTASSGKQAYITFTVRDDARPNTTFLFTQNTNTYQAYNNWGGKSLYDFNSSGGPATKVSYNRPYAIEVQDPGAELDNGSSELLHSWEYNAIRWLEKEGYDVSYATSVDLHEQPSLLLGHRGYLSFGHNEYWSMAMRTNVINAADHGVHMGFFGANPLYWQIRFETSPVNGAVDRTIVCYKTTADPVKDNTQTIQWRQLNMPEAAFIGVMYRYDPVAGDIIVQNTSHWVYAGTGLHDGDRLVGLLGYEVDSTDVSTPASAVVLAASPYTGGNGIAQPSNATIYTRPSGAIVFGGGSMQWSWGLDDYNAPLYRGAYATPAAQQIVRNILNRFAAINVNITPTTANLGPAQTQQFAAQVVGSTNTAVTWSVAPAVGTVSPTGLYTAPSTVAATQVITVTATSVADTTKFASASVTLNPPGSIQPIRVNVGGPAYTDSLGQVWAADTGFTGGTIDSTAATIANTNDQTLYKTERWGTFSYTFSVPNGTFDVTLKFAEIYFTAANQRLFNVAINGTPVLTNFDIVAQAGGANRALDKTFTVTAGGSITVQFTAGTLDDPKLSAIQITASGGGGSTVGVSVSPPNMSLSAGQAQQFAATVTGTTNSVVTWSMSPSVGTLSTTGLYTAPASIATQQTVTITATSTADPTKKANATVTLLPAVPTISVTVSPASVSLAGGQSQQFTATVTGTANTAVTWSMNPAVGTLSATGLYTAPATITTPQTVTVTASNGTDTVYRGNATVTLTAPVTFTPIRVNAGGPAYTDTLGQVWAADTGFSGGSTDTTTTAITNTTDQTLYKSERWGPMTYTFTVPAGTYDVTLKFAEIFFTAANKRLFNVAINGGAVLTAFDVYAQAGGANRAVDKTFTVTSTGSIAIAFTAGTVDDPKISAIQIVASGPQIGVTVAPPTATLSASQIQQFNATVTNTTNTAVTWSMSPSVGTLSATGLYTAPASITTQQTVTITATSAADTTKKGTATVTLMPPAGTVNVTVAPAAVTLTGGKTQQFTATVTGNANTAVTWSMSPSVGTLSAAGLYTAPASITTQQAVTITATSAADPTKKGTATVTLTPFTPIRVNAGGPAYTDTLGQVWSADTGFTGGSTASTTSAIANTTDQTLYKTERWGASSYTFAVPNGTYTVTLKMAEIYFTTANQRLFSIVINGTTVASNVDIVTLAGGANRALDLTYAVTATTGAVTIQLVTGTADDPKIGGIQIVGG